MDRCGDDKGWSLQEDLRLMDALHRPGKAALDVAVCGVDGMRLYLPAAPVE